MTESKYAIANIKIPIEIFPDGEWIHHNDRISIQICEIDKLPPISTINNEELSEIIQNIFVNNKNESRIPIPKEDEPFPVGIVSHEENESKIAESLTQISDETLQDIKSENLLEISETKEQYIDRAEYEHHKSLRSSRKPSRNITFKNNNTKGYIKSQNHTDQV